MKDKDNDFDLISQHQHIKIIIYKKGKQNSIIKMSFHYFESRPVYTYYDISIVDSQRGVYVDSNNMNPEQFTRYFRTQSNFLRPDLNERQANWHCRRYLLGEKLLCAKKDQNLYRIGLLGRMTNNIFMANNLSQMFGKSFAIYSLSQNRNFGGYHRTDVEVQKIAKWAQDKYQHSRSLGLLPHSPADGQTQEQRVRNITNKLRQRYLGKPQQAHAKKESAAAQSDE